MCIRDRQIRVLRLPNVYTISFHWPQGACAACGATPAIHRWSGMLYCSPACGAWLGDEAAKNWISTRYAKKRRWLRNHRAQMRVVQEVIEQHDLEDEVEDRVVEETGNTCYWLGFDSDMDVSSDAEGPEAAATEELTAAKQELEDRNALIEALTERLQRERIVQDLERERMTRADLESRLSRA